LAIIKEGKIIQLEEIDNLRKKQLKKVTIEFDKTMYKEIFILPGVENTVNMPGNNVSFMFSGNINDLVHYLSGKKVMNLMIEEPSLDEIFLHYYRS
jgi:ABC-2 type transport system ATP-binding protein